VTGAFAALSVHDLDRVATWYGQHLGFQVQVRSQPANGPKGAILTRQGARLELLEFSTAKSREAWGLPAEAHQVHGILKLGFEVSDIDALFANAQAKRLEVFFPLVTPPNSPLRTFGLLDPEGNIVQFFGK
jgi:catechol-2,3-dioxygenase